MINGRREGSWEEYEVGGKMLERKGERGWVKRKIQVQYCGEGSSRKGTRKRDEGGRKKENERMNRGKLDKGRKGGKGKGVRVVQIEE